MNCCWINIIFKTNNLVFFNTKNLQEMWSCKKLTARYIKSFKILECISAVVYKLHLSANMRIHFVFHVLFLKKYSEDKDIADSAIYELFSDEKYEIEKIVDFKIKFNQSHYLVKWKDWSNEYNKWIKKWDLVNARKLLKQYKKRQK